MKNVEKCCKVTGALFLAGMIACSLMLTSCGGEKKEEKSFNKAMDEFKKLSESQKK